LAKIELHEMIWFFLSWMMATAVTMALMMATTAEPMLPQHLEN